MRRLLVLVVAVWAALAIQAWWALSNCEFIMPFYLWGDCVPYWKRWLWFSRPLAAFALLLALVGVVQAGRAVMRRRRRA